MAKVTKHRIIICIVSVIVLAVCIGVASYTFADEIIEARDDLGYLAPPEANSEQVNEEFIELAEEMEETTSDEESPADKEEIKEDAVDQDKCEADAGEDSIDEESEEDEDAEEGEESAALVNDVLYDEDASNEEVSDEDSEDGASDADSSDENEESETADLTLNLATKYPSKYDGRTLSYSSKIKVKNQGTLGICWACALATTAERSWMQEQVNNGRTPSTVAFSPLHLAYFTYNHATDELKDTANDSTYINTTSRKWYSIGGNNSLGVTTLSTWSGIANDSIKPLASHSTGAAASKISFSTADARKDSLIIENAYTPYGVDEIKEAITEKGAVASSYFSNAYYYNSSKTAYYCSDDRVPNHAVAIIGWDNSYAASNFKGSKAGTPPGNGAWICQNSWGSDWGNKGYFYISFYDATLKDAMCVDMQSSSAYDHNYHYDGSSISNNLTIRKEGSVANFFTVKANSKERLEAVAFNTNNVPGSSSSGICQNFTYNFRVDIYKNAKKPADLVEANLVDSVLVSNEGTAVTNVKLNKSILMDNGTDFAVQVTFLKCREDSSRSCRFAIESNSSPYTLIKSKAGFEKGQSYRKLSGTSSWQDCADYSQCARIKAYTKAATIEEKNNKVSVSGLSSRSYTGSVQKPTVKVTVNGRTVPVTVTYNTDCKNVGTHKVTICGTGKYSGTLTKSFKINPKSTSFKVYSRSKAFYTNIAKAEGAGYYQIAYRKKGTSTWKYVTTTSRYRTVKKLKAKTYYQVKVRSVKKVSGSSYYSGWTGIKTIKTK